jgi:pilus assembly protein CpaF
MIASSIFAESIAQLLAPIAPFLQDPSVSEVMINGPSEVYVERRGQLAKVEARFASAHELTAALRNVAQYVGRPFDELHPILEGHLPDGSRIEALMPPVAPGGPSVAIRRFSKGGLSAARLVELGALPADAAELLAALVACQKNVIVSGGTGTGKTSLLNALSSFIPAGDRIVVIEDARELQLQHEHVVRLEARPADPRGLGAISIRDLFRASLRMRPDRVVIGEIRGAEALDLIQAMTSGHGGCMSTLHASYPTDALNRLETLALMAKVELPLSALRSQIASGVDVIVQLLRLKDGARKISHITEVSSVDEHGNLRLRDLYEGRYVREGVFQLLPTGRLPSCHELIEAQGRRLPEAMLAAAERRHEGRDG